MNMVLPGGRRRGKTEEEMDRLYDDDMREQGLSREDAQNRLFGREQFVVVTPDERKSRKKKKFQV